jgi:hypothetical protein
MATIKKDFVPGPDRDFLGWFSFLLSYVSSDGRLARFGIPEEEFNRLHAEITDFAEKLQAANKPETRTKAAVQAKTDSRKVVEKDGRMFIRRFIDLNPQVTNADRDDMGLPIYKTTRDPAPVATMFPWVKIITNLIRHLSFDFGGAEASKAKPEGQHGMEMAGIVAPEKPADIHELTMSYFDTHTPLVIEFTEEQRGKTFWFVVRWENTRGQKGPWSDIMSAIIP